MHSRLGSTTLLQLAFPEESNWNLLWENSQWDNTVVQKKKKKKKKLCPRLVNKVQDRYKFWSLNLKEQCTVHCLNRSDGCTLEPQMEDHPLFKTTVLETSIALDIRLPSSVKPDPFSRPHFCKLPLLWKVQRFPLLNSKAWSWSGCSLACFALCQVLCHSDFFLALSFHLTSVFSFKLFHCKLSCMMYSVSDLFVMFANFTPVWPLAFLAKFENSHKIEVGFCCCCLLGRSWHFNFW